MNIFKNIFNQPKTLHHYFSVGYILLVTIGYILIIVAVTLKMLNIV